MPVNFVGLTYISVPLLLTRLIVEDKGQMGDEYAAQIRSEYELTEDIVDDWWE